jgi:hypothetical protein
VTVKLAGALGAAVLLGALGWAVYRRLDDRRVPWWIRGVQESCEAVDGALVHGRTDLWDDETRAALGELIAAARRQLEAEGRG